MRWRFVDRIESFEPWNALRARKLVSFEEYSLLKPLGRKGDFPESLLIETAVEALRWLVAASSEFSQTASLAGISDLSFLKTVKLGQALETTVHVNKRSEDSLQADSTVSVSGECVAHGKLTLSLLPMQENFDRDLIAGMWQELYAKA